MYDPCVCIKVTRSKLDGWKRWKYLTMHPEPCIKTAGAKIAKATTEATRSRLDGRGPRSKDNIKKTGNPLATKTRKRKEATRSKLDGRGRSERI